MWLVFLLNYLYKISDSIMDLGLLCVIVTVVLLGGNSCVSNFILGLLLSGIIVDANGVLAQSLDGR